MAGITDALSTIQNGVVAFNNLTIKLGNFLGALRSPLNSDRTYYVRTDGNDSNSGLSDTAGGAFLTVARAMNIAATIDTSIYQLTIQIDAGTWAVPITLPRTLGTLSPILTGVGSTTIINTAGNCITCQGRWSVQNMKLLSSVGTGFVAVAGGALTFSGVEFGACVYGCVIFPLSVMVPNGNYTISGGGAYHIYNSGGGFFPNGGVAATLTGTPNFSSAFIGSVLGGISQSSGAAFIGSATGSRYLVATNGGINSAGGGANYYPGNAAGTITAPGWYV
jgi:hypothetical protein